MSEFDRLLRSKGYLPPRYCTAEALFSSRIYKDLDVPNARERTRVETEAKAFIRASTRVALTDSKLLAELKDPAIDSGEAILLAHLLRNNDSIMITGDKKCLTALTANAKYAHHCVGLKSRIMHLERLIALICDQYSWALMRAKICACPGADFVIARALDAKHTDAQAKVNLVGGVSSFEAKCAGLLMAAF